MSVKRSKGKDVMRCAYEAGNVVKEGEEGGVKVIRRREREGPKNRLAKL